jgi:membrane protein YqaA with SNARE-associated domain
VLRLSKGRIIAGIVMLAAIILIVSSTLGREIMAGKRPGLWSFSIVHFAGYLFFLLMPVEALVPYYQSEDHAAMILVGLSVTTALGAQLIDYGIGYLVSERVIRWLGEAKYARFRTKIDKWGGWAIFVFNLFPLSSPNMLLVAGMVRFRVARAMAISAGGLVAKYLAIVYLFG